MFSGTHVLEEKKDGFINAVLQVEQEFRDIIANSFSNDPSFFKFFELACKKFISQFKNGSASNHLAAYADRVLRKTEKMSDQERDQALDIIVSFFFFFFLSVACNDSELFPSYYLTLFLFSFLICFLFFWRFLHSSFNFVLSILFFTFLIIYCVHRFQFLTTSKKKTNSYIIIDAFYQIVCSITCVRDMAYVLKDN